MKALIAPALVAAVALAGCQTVGGQPSGSITAPSGILATYNAICVGSPGNPPVTAAVDTLTASGTLALNKTQAAIYNTMKTNCSYGPPTTPEVIALWALTTFAQVQSAFPNVKIKL